VSCSIDNAAIFAVVVIWQPVLVHSGDGDWQQGRFTLGAAAPDFWTAE
jgi:hypothetical protein